MNFQSQTEDAFGFLFWTACHTSLMAGASPQ